jgi:hypothetical protein
MTLDDYQRWFNHAFWKAFKDQAFPITIPQTVSDKKKLVERVYNSITSARYAPSIPESEIVINKGHGVARTVPVFCIEDYCVYYFCIKELESVLCTNRTPNTFGGWTLGGRLRQQENTEIECALTEYGRYSFNPHAWKHAFGEFNSLLFAQLDQRKYSHVLQFDLANFYDSVRLDTLERSIREEAPPEKGWIITLLFYLLNHWNRRNTGLHPQSVGLPQDVLADCSRILSNYYLQKYDRFAAALCSNSGALYFRYADDTMILLNDASKVESLLLLLTRRLDRIGLRVNQKKVFVWKARQLQEHRCRNIQSIFAETGDNKNPALVKQYVEAYLSLSGPKLKTSWNQGRPMLNRLIWANLESLPKSLLNRLLVHFTADDYLLLADSKKIGRIDELNKIRHRPINLSRHLQTHCEQSVHNAFHYEVLAFARSTNRTALKAFCESRLAELSTLMSGHEVP